MAYKISAKVSEKGAVSLLGLQRFPVTLYAEQWAAIIQCAPALTKWIDANKAKLATKEAKPNSNANSLN